jgi:hypothetical protein
MRSPAIILNRSAPLTLPLVGLITCIATLWSRIGLGDDPNVVTLSFFFGMKLLFPIAVVLGVAISLCDWIFPKMRKLLVAASGVAFAVSLLLGWATAQSILYF